MRVVHEIVSVDGTRKFLIELDDKLRIESVLIPHKRTMCACISSQVGCAMKCSFCATGKMGFTRNLTTEEIVGQLDLMKERATEQITNVVFMGMGEPLKNYDNVVSAVAKINESFSWHKITVSTVGIPDKIVSLGNDAKCRLALSLHAPNDELRSELVPVNNAFQIDDLISACLKYPATKHDPVMIEYVLLARVNDEVHHAEELATVLHRLPHVMVSLIPYNPINSVYNRPDHDRVLKFKQILIDAGIKTIIRTTKGMDSNAACGMLSTVTLK